MKTIIARFQELKKNVDEVEIDGEIVDANKIEGALRSVGIALRDEVTGQFRDLDDVFLELSSIWSTLDRNTQRYIATIAAGSRQQSRFLAMMDNYERTTELVNIANESAGASASQFNKTLGSIEAKINKLSSSAEELVGTIFPNEFIRNILDIANNILQVFNAVGDEGPIALTVFSVMVFKVIKNISNGILSGLRTASDAFDDFKKDIDSSHPRLKVFIDYYNATTGKKIESVKSDIEGNNNNTTISTNKKNTLQNPNNSSKNETSKTISIWTNIANLVGSILSLVSLTYSANTTSSGLIGGTIGQSTGQLVGQIGGQFAGQKLGVLIGGAAGGPIGAAIGLAIGSAVGGPIGTLIGTAIGNGIDKSKGILSESFSEAMEEAAAKFQEEVNKANKEESELSSLISEYEKLTEVLGSGEGTLEQQERLKEVNEQLISLYPQQEKSFSTELQFREENLKLLKEELEERRRLQQESQLKLGLSTDYVEVYTNLEKVRAESPKNFEENLDANRRRIASAFSLVGGLSQEEQKQFSKEVFEAFNIYSKDPTNEQTYKNLIITLEKILKDERIKNSRVQSNNINEALNFLRGKNGKEGQGEKYLKYGIELQSAEEQVNTAIKQNLKNYLLSAISLEDEDYAKILQENFEYLFSYVTNSMKMSPSDIFKNGEFNEKVYAEYVSEIEKHYNQVSSTFKNLTEEEVRHVQIAQSLLGLVEPETIKYYILKNIDDSKDIDIIRALFGVNSDGSIKNGEEIPRAYGNLLIQTVEEINNVAKSNPEVAALLSGTLSEFMSGDRDVNSFTTAYSDIINQYGSNSEIANKFFSEGSQLVKSYSSDLFEASATVEKLTEKLNKLEEYKDAIQTGTLTQEQVQNLITAYNLTLDNFQATAEGYKLIGVNYYELIAQATKKTQEDYLQQLKILALVKEQYLKEQKGTTKDSEEWNNLQEKIDEVTNSIILYGQAVSSIKAPELYVSSMQNAADNMDKLVSNTELLQSALDQYNKYGKISGTMFSQLIQANKDYIDVIDVANGQITINKERLEELRQQEIQNYKTENEISIKKLEDQNAEIDAAITAGEELKILLSNEIDSRQALANIGGKTKEFLSKSEIAYAKVATEANTAIDTSSENLANNTVTDANDISTAIGNIALSYRGAGQTIINAIGGIIKKWNAWKKAQKNDTVAEDTEVTVGTNVSVNTKSSNSRENTTATNLDELLKLENYSWEDYKKSEGLEIDGYLKTIDSRIDELKALKNKNNETIAELKALSDLALKISQTGGTLGADKSSSKNQKDYNLEFEKFYNILSKIADIQRELNELERQRKGTTHYEELAEIDAKRLNLSEALIASRKIYLQQQKDEQKKIGIQLGTYKKYVTVLDGYLSVNRAAIEAIKDETLGETLKDLIKEYDDLSESIDKTNEEILKEKEYQDEIIESARDYSQTLKDTLLGEVVETHEKEIQAVKDKYAAIKEEDTEYLNSLRKNLQKERDLRNQSEEEEELTKLEKRLALLKRDTSGIYASEILQLESEIADMRQELADSQTDKMLEELEEQYSSEHKKMDEETQYLDNKHKENLETMKLYWEEVEDIMTRGYDAILEYLKVHDEEFITGSQEEQEAWLEEWKKNINEALAYRQGLENNFGRNEQNNSNTETPDTFVGEQTTTTPSQEETAVKTTPAIGEQVQLKDGKKIYASNDAKKGVNPYFGTGPYTVLWTKNGRAQVKYANSKTGGAIGWLRFEDLVGYSRGGLVTSTGPVMVHGSKQRPEAFLSADDTKLIMNLKNALASVAKKDNSFASGVSNAEKGGDTFYEIHIHVDELNSDYSVDEMMTAMERKIVNDARSRNVIAIKRSR